MEDQSLFGMRNVLDQSLNYLERLRELMAPFGEELDPAKADVAVAYDHLNSLGHWLDRKLNEAG